MKMTKPYRSKKYLKWVSSLPCSATDYQADDAHHIIGYGLGGMGTKASDFFTIPLTRDKHVEMHRDSRRFEDFYGLQPGHVVETLRLGLELGKIDPDRLRVDISAITNRGLRKQMEKCFE